MDFDARLPKGILPGKLNVNLGYTVDEWRSMKDYEDRRLFIYGPILPLGDSQFEDCSVDGVVENIMRYNRIDQGLDPKDRKPIRLYINSPGGDVNEGFALISTIELSKTPIYTINIGQWSSMAFLIGIAGHRRFALPYSMFLMHDGSQIALGSTNKVQDQVDFTKRFEREVVKKHILKYSNMKSADYDALARVELYMLPKDALEHEFIDEIITDIDTIL